MKRKELTDRDREIAEEEIVRAARQIRFNISEYTVEVLTQKVRSGEFYVPAYQRNLTWKEGQKSAFIESIIIGLPIPFLFFWQAEDGRLEIVDGSQRLRTMTEFLVGTLRLADLELLPALNGFAFQDLDKSRQRKIENRSIRGIILDSDTTPATRSEMFSRINTGGTNANEAEIRRGVLPGPFTNLIVELSESPIFVRLTPIPERIVALREREELLARFFAYTQMAQIDEANDIVFPKYRDQPKAFLYEYIELENREANNHQGRIQELRQTFDTAMDFIDRVFPNGFLKSPNAKQVPRTRFEAIAVGSALAIKAVPQIANSQPDVSQWIDGEEFNKVTTSGGSNVKSKLVGRIGFVRRRLLETVQ